MATHTKSDPYSAVNLIEKMLLPWEESIANPEQAQLHVLEKLINDYSKTGYGKIRGALNVDNIQDYRRVFPAATYEDFKPELDKVMAGDIEQLLSEEPIGWAITRGTTKGESKYIPMTPTDLRLRVSAGRAMLVYVLMNKKFDLFSGVNLNLNFPSEVGTIKIGLNEVKYGYSSGIYAKYVSAQTPIQSVPSQEDIDALGSGKSISDWEKRFELAYQSCKERDVTLVGGVFTTAHRFARYLKKFHNLYPKDIWNTRIMTLGSAPAINTKHQSVLTSLYGDVIIREIYGATEGMFGQQRDQNRAWVPNYDQYLLEVVTKSGTKMLHEMKPGEMGGLVVSTPVFPRYRIGDIIRAFKPPYFRCIGREKWWIPLKYAWDEIFSLNFDRL
jgi:hypothetical protein